jgi:hypothetical protein
MNSPFQGISPQSFHIISMSLLDYLEQRVYIGAIMSHSGRPFVFLFVALMQQFMTPVRLSFHPPLLFPIEVV